MLRRSTFFAGASFVSEDNPEQRARLLIGVVRAIEDVIAFPVTFSSEAATYVGEDDGTQLFLHAKIVIANVTQRLLESDQKCLPLAPAEILRRLECLAHKWIHKNPVDEFFAAIPTEAPPDRALGGPRTRAAGRRARRRSGDALHERARDARRAVR